MRNVSQTLSCNSAIPLIHADDVEDLYTFVLTDKQCNKALRSIGALNRERVNRGLYDPRVHKRELLSLANSAVYKFCVETLSIRAENEQQNIFNGPTRYAIALALFEYVEFC